MKMNMMKKKGLLYDIFTTPKSYPNIDTLDDLYKSGLEIYVRHAGLLDDIFGDEPTGTTLGDLKTHRLKLTNDSDLNARIVAYGNVAGLGRSENFDFDNLQVSKDDGKYNLHFGAECPRCVNV
jgi:hypothetical protein